MELNYDSRDTRKRREGLVGKHLQQKHKDLSSDLTTHRKGDTVLHTYNPALSRQRRVCPQSMLASQSSQSVSPELSERPAWSTE